MTNKLGSSNPNKIKKYTLKDDTDLFAKELNLNPKDYKIGKIVTIALKTIKSSDNPLVMERINSYKEIIKRASVELKTHIKKAKEDKPIFDILGELWDLKDGPADIDIQELAQYLEKKLNQSRVKESTKPKGHSKTIANRNDKIRKQYYKLREKGWSKKESINLILKDYPDLKFSSIETYIKK